MLGLGFEEKGGEAVQEKNGEDGGVEEGEPVIGFDEPVVVDDAAEGRDVDETVEGLPVFAAEPADPAFRRRDR